MSEGLRPDVTSWGLIGAGGHAQVLHDVLVRLGDRVVAVSGDPRGRQWDLPVVATDDELADLARRTGAAVVLGIGDDARRATLLDWATAAGLDLPPVVASTATVAPSATLGEGTVVLEHAHVGPGARLGRAVVVNTAAVVEHDAVVGDHSHVAPGAVLLGAAEVGTRTLVGSGARVLPGVRVGSGVVVGAGAVVVGDVPDDTVVTGVPARPSVVLQ
jgi:sugar O-acyltransferase (sialic acid O-acetyltransferase NeuD family)